MINLTGIPKNEREVPNWLRRQSTQDPQTARVYREMSILIDRLLLTQDILKSELEEYRYEP
jgi:hypothetical protein